VVNGWAEVASVLGRRLNLSVSTVQIWGREAKLPVHRLKTRRRAFPYVREGELSAWIKERTVSTPRFRKSMPDFPSLCTVPWMRGRRISRFLVRPEPLSP
jgi:hypothetical protein